MVLWRSITKRGCPTLVAFHESVLKILDVLTFSCRHQGDNSCRFGNQQFLVQYSTRLCSTHVLPKKGHGTTVALVLVTLCFTCDNERFFACEAGFKEQHLEVPECLAPIDRWLLVVELPDLRIQTQSPLLQKVVRGLRQIFWCRNRDGDLLISCRLGVFLEVGRPIDISVGRNDLDFWCDKIVLVVVRSRHTKQLSEIPATSIGSRICMSVGDPSANILGIIRLEGLFQSPNCLITSGRTLYDYGGFN